VSERVSERVRVRERGRESLMGIRKLYKEKEDVF